MDAPFVVNGQKYVMVPGALEKLSAGREAQGLLGWTLHLVDKNGGKHTGFIRGPLTPEEVIASAKITFRLWTLVDFERATTSNPPASARPVPPSAYQYGVLESLHNRRKR